MHYGTFLVLGNRKPYFRNSKSYDFNVNVYKFSMSWNKPHIIYNEIVCQAMLRNEIRGLDQICSLVKMVSWFINLSNMINAYHGVDL